MSTIAPATYTPTGTDGWGRRRLLGLIIGVLATVIALVGGLGYAVYLTFAPSPDPAAAVSSSQPISGIGSVQARRDGIAAARMLSVTPQDARPAPPSTQTAPSIAVPPATTSGPGGVPTGFPRTPDGAIGQLAAIETTVFQAMSMPLTTEVHRHWTMPDPSAPHDPTPGTPTPSGRTAGDTQPEAGVAGWEIARHVQSFLATAQMGPEKDLTTVVTATPVAGLIKGADGPDWVVACVLLEVRAVITTEARIGFGHCERMQWHDGRWLIAPGAAPARAPSTWPGSQRSIDAGWRAWSEADSSTVDPSAGDRNPAPAPSIAVDAAPDAGTTREP